MSETKNEQQDVDLENNEAEEQEQPAQETPEETPEEPEVNVEELQAELAKYKRINEKLNKQVDQKQESAPKDAPKEQKSSDKSGELDFGQKAYLKSYGISGSDELALVRQFQTRGFELDSIVEDDVFTAKLDNLRQAKQTAAATPKGTKRSGQTGTTEVDIAVAKYKESGELPKDFKLRNEVIDKAIAQKSSSAPFG